MNTKNLPVYYIPHVRFKNDFSYFVHNFKKDSEYPVCQGQTILKRDEIEIVFRKDFLGNNIVSVPRSEVELFSKEVTPKFKLGQVVTRIDAKQYIPYRVAEIDMLSGGDIWYRNSWSLLTGLEAGVCEDQLRLATAEEIEANRGFIFNARDEAELFKKAPHLADAFKHNQ